MSQNDFTIANQGFPAFRADLNSALQALASSNSGATAPSTTFANQLWYDTANNILYIRNEDNDAWIKLFTLDQTNDNVESLHADTIAEATSGNGVAVDGVTLKDGELGTTASPVAIHSTSLNGGQFGGRRNIIINGAMQVAQRGTSFSGFTTSEYHLDNFRNGMGDTTARFTVTQASSGLNGFPHCLKYDCTTAEASLSNGNARMFLHTRFEGQDLQQLKKGTSDAEKVTVSFYVKSNKTGTYILELEDKDNTRQISKAYTISSANTWEQKIITFDGDTTGAFDNDNNNSCHLTWHLIAGTNYQSGTLNTSWASQTHANRAVGNVNIGDSTDNTWEITGVSMEVGDFPNGTPFEHRSVGEELALCQRYFQICNFNVQDYPPSAGYTDCHVSFLNQMRATPSATITEATKFNISGATGVHELSVNSCRVENQTSGNQVRTRQSGGSLALSADL